MEVFLYAAELLCEECGEKAREALDAEGKRPADPEDEGTYDSDDYPKGPFPDGGGDADSPCHCGDCGAFLENALTAEGLAYVQEEVEAARNEFGGIKNETVAEWANFYEIKAKHEEDE